MNRLPCKIVEHRTTKWSNYNEDLGPNLQVVILSSAGSEANWVMASEIFDILAPELHTYDVLGSRGCAISTPRCNLLVDIKSLHFDDSSISLSIDQYSPEGFGIEQFFKDSLSIPGDELLNTNQVLVWDVQSTMPHIHQKIWFFSVWQYNSGVFHFDEQSSWQVVDKSSCHRRSLHVLEFFGGGMGGWKAAGSFLTRFFQQQWETIAIENQLDIAMCYAITHETGLLTDLTQLKRNFFSEQHTSWVICKDIRDRSWHPFVAEWGVDAILLSPPCQPWSGAATSPGVERCDGKLTAIGLLQCRWFQAPLHCPGTSGWFSVSSPQTCCVEDFALVGLSNCLWESSGLGWSIPFSPSTISPSCSSCAFECHSCTTQRVVPSGLPQASVVVSHPFAIWHS